MGLSDKMKKFSKVQAGFITLLTALVFPVLTHFWVLLAGIDKSKPVSEIGNLELWGYIGVIALISGISVMVALCLVYVCTLSYNKLVGKSGKEPDYF